MFKTCLGDAVYVEYDGYHILLTTNNGVYDTNIVALDPVVREGFKNWLFRLYDHLNGGVEPNPEQREEVT